MVQPHADQSHASRRAPERPGPQPLIQAYFELNHLKQLYRQGWLRVGIPPERCESVAEHSLGVALLCLFIADCVVPRGGCLQGRPHRAAA